MSVAADFHPPRQITFAENLEQVRACSTYRSSEMCKIDYFLIARNYRMMLYLRRSQINVPRDRLLGKTLPALKLQQKV